MDTKRNQTLEEIEENKIVNEHYQNRVMLIKKLLKTSRLATVDLCVHIDISEASYYRYINFTSYMKADIFIHACLFLKQYIESHHIPYTQEEKRLIKTLYNPQNEMFATFQTKRYFIQNETSSKKIIFQSIQEAVKKHWKILFLPVLFSLNSVGYVS